MIGAIDKRLLDWAEWRMGSVQGVAGCNGVMAAIIAGKGVVVRSTATEIYVADAVLDTDQAVMKLEEDLKRVVELQYLECDLSAEQRARKARVSRKTYYRRLGTAHQHVLFFLQPKAAVKANPVRDGLLAKRRVGVSVVRVEC
ncbi:MAG: hypothetical protein V7629_17265 [Motiliproteus sp.]